MTIMENTVLPLIWKTRQTAPDQSGYLPRLVRLLAWRGRSGRLCAGPYWVMIPTTQTLEDTRWTGRAEWVQGISHYARHRLTQLLNCDEATFFERHPDGITIVVGQRWRTLNTKVND
jgi:hypothetical protein